MRTSELTGPLLDYWTAMADRAHLHITEPFPAALRAPDDVRARTWVAIADTGSGRKCYLVREFPSKVESIPYSPSTDGQLGTAIIERLKIGVQYFPDGWRACHGGLSWGGSTFLQAAMRVRVWMVFGNQVPAYPD